MIRKETSQSANNCPKHEDKKDDDEEEMHLIDYFLINMPLAITDSKYIDSELEN